MNISDFPKQLINYEPPAGRLSRRAGNIEDPTVEKSLESVKAEKEKFALECERKPWLRGLSYDDVHGRDIFDRYKMTIINHELSDTQRAYDAFMTNLAVDHPELAAKKFGFTMSPSADIVILDYDGDLSAREITTLTESMNNSFRLKSLLQNSADCIIALAEYAPASYGGYRQLGIENFHEIIDFRKVLNSGVEDLLEEAFRQVRSRAEACDPPPISVFA